VGSARSVRGFDVHHALEECADLLEQFGGHTHAAGLHLKPENLQAFIEKFERIAQEGLANISPKADLPVDLQIPLEALSLSFYDKLLVRLSPYGPGNMLPNFVSGPVFVTKSPFVMKEEHLKIYVGSTPDERGLEVVGFGMKADFYDGLCAAYEQRLPIQLVYHLEINEYLGNRTLQLRALDFASFN
jgi:single-stranded-DNA-specific exonuclease